LPISYCRMGLDGCDHLGHRICDSTKHLNQTLR
jgi:hypothetical protein